MSVPPFAGRLVLPLAGVVGLAHLVIAGLQDGYFFDEVYMLSLGRHHLDWGFADQPPITPLLAALMDLIAPGSILVLRVPAVLATAAAVVVAALIAREFGGDRRAQVLTAAAQATALWITLAGHWLTPYTLEPVQWLLLFWLLIRWIRVRDDRLLILLGLVAGIAAQTKFQVLLLCAVLLLSVLIMGPRDLLRRPLLWAGVGIAGVIAAPTLLWQAANGWPQLQMGPITSSESLLYGGRPGLAVGLMIMAGVAGTVLLGYGLWRLLRANELVDYRFLAVTFLALYVFFVVTEGRPYYLNGLYGVIAAAGALGLQRRREAGRPRGRWIAWPAYALSVVAAAGMLIMSMPMAAPDVGRDMAQRTATAYQQLSDTNRDRTVIMGRSYILAAYLDGYGRQHGLPNAFSTNRGYGYAEPPPEDKDQVLYLGDPRELRPHFDRVTKIVDNGPDGSLWLCEGRRESWAELWPRLRNLSVA